MYIGFGDYTALGGHHYFLTLVNRTTCYVWTYDMRELSGKDAIKYLQEFRLDVGRLPSKFYNDFDN